MTSLKTVGTRPNPARPLAGSLHHQLLASCRVAAVTSSLYLRYHVIYFLRLMPWGTNLFESICISFLVYSVTICYAYLSWTRSPDAGSKAAAVARSVRPKLHALVLGTFEPSARMATAVSACLNFVGLLFIIDFIYRAQILHPSTDLVFQRVGFVTSDSARISVRCVTEATVQISFREETALRSTDDGTQPWEAAETLVLTAETDYVTTFILDNLQPDTQYVYRTNASHTGRFHTHPLRPTRWSMVSSSCIKSFWPYNPTDHSLSIHGLDFLSQSVQTRDISFVLFLGDFIYIDLPRRFGWSKEHYTQAYRQVYASPSWSTSLTETPWLHAYDDHEISNNWSANETGIWNDAIGPFMAYHHAGNPSPPRLGETYYTFNHGDVDFFVLDTRRYRSQESVKDGPAKSMLGAMQRADLEVWLDTAPGWKVVVSSVPFTRNWRSPDVEDSWGGFLWERERLLERMWKTRGVLIISGDRHEHATTYFPPPHSHNDSRVIEFSTSPLNQFYEPFRRDYLQVEDTDIEVHHHYKGHSKFGIFTFDTANTNTWTMHFELIVDGKKTWEHVVRQTRGLR